MLKYKLKNTNISDGIGDGGVMAGNLMYRANYEKNPHFIVGKVMEN